MRPTLFQRLALRLYPGADNPRNEAARARVGLLEGWSSLAINILLAMIKGVLAWLSGSLSLLADTFHTLADSLTSLVVIVGFRLSRKPADADHPFGHGRIESIAGLIIGVLLGVAAFELGHAAITRLLTPTAINAPSWLIGVIAFTALLKELLARFSFDLGKLIDSDALEADAWHHRSDVFATLLVVVAFVFARFGMVWIDGVVGILVALLIGFTAVQIVVRAANPLIGEAPSEEVLRQISDSAHKVHGVLDVHEIVMQRYGARAVLSLHIQVARERNIVEAHAISHEVEEALAAALNAHVTVHIDPAGAKHFASPVVAEVLNSELKTMDGCESFHDLRLSHDDHDCLCVALDITTREELSDAQKAAHTTRLAKAVQERFPEAKLKVHFDPPFCADVPAG
ncbi:MAG: cation transporter [Deltaproteobacteria bacterium]|nr:cation transporter [Deltaproteobacteria bacterium]